MLPSGPVAPGRFTPATDPKEALAAYEKSLEPPAQVLAETFGIIRVNRTLLHADSIAYVFERRRDLLGRETCRAFRITEHPPPPPPTPVPSVMGGFARPYLPDRNPDLRPVLEYVDVSCSDPRIEKVVPGSLATPVPRRP